MQKRAGIKKEVAARPECEYLPTMSKDASAEKRGETTEDCSDLQRLLEAQDLHSSPGPDYGSDNREEAVLVP